MRRKERLQETTALLWLIDNDARIEIREGDLDRKGSGRKELKGRKVQGEASSRRCPLAW